MSGWQVKCLECGHTAEINDILEQNAGCPNCGNHIFEVVGIPEKVPYGEKQLQLQPQPV